MFGINKAKLLKEDAVKQEIDKYKWIASEKAGYDIGFDRAADEWFKNNAEAWVKQHTAKPKKTTRSAKKV